MRRNKLHKTDWNLIAKHLSGETNATEDEQLNQWMMSSDENAFMFDQVKNDWDRLNSVNNMKKVDVDSAWNKLHSRIKGEEIIEEKVEFAGRRVVLLPRILRYAAVIVLMAAIGTLVTLLNPSRNFPDGYISENTTQSSDIKEVILPDGSIVAINAESNFSYPEKFEGDTRKVYIEGEAFFDIAKDESKPFIIDANGSEIEVVGTSFNVNTKIPDKDVEVTVKTGKVKLYKKGNKDDNVLLMPGEVGVIENSVVNKFENADENFISWKTKEMIFRATDMIDVLAIIERTYNISITYSNLDLSQIQYTVTFENTSADSVLQVICSTHNWKYEKTKSGYRLMESNN